jgi:hypothetical protein
LKELKRDYNVYQPDGTSGKIKFSTIKNNFSTYVEINNVIKMLQEAAIPVVQDQKILPIKKKTDEELVSVINDTKTELPSEYSNEDLQKFYEMTRAIKNKNTTPEELAEKLYELCTLVGFSAENDSQKKAVIENFSQSYKDNIGVITSLVTKLQRLFTTNDDIAIKRILRMFTGKVHPIKLSSGYRFVVCK